MKALLIGIALAIASFWAPDEAIDPVARLIVPAVALLATSIFPCMSLAVGSLKAEQRAPAQVDELYEQLRTIMRVLVVTFVLAVTAVACIVGLSALVAASGMTPPARGPASVEPYPLVAFSIRALLALVCVVLALLGGRIVAVANAFFAILDINRKHALLVARSKVQSDRDKALEGARRQNFTPDSDAPRPLERVG